MFVWNGISSKEMGLIVESLPSIEIPQREVEEVRVEGTDGHYTITKDYEGSLKEVICHYEGNNYDELAEWLNGSGKVIFSNLEDRYYNAYISNAIPLTSIIENHLSYFPIIFRCNPFGYSIYNDDIELTINNSELVNQYTYFSMPKIEIFGTGDITVTITGNITSTFTVKAVSGSIVVDSNLKSTYKGNTSLNSKFVASDYPILPKDKFIVSWTGTVTKIKITPNWRYLI